MVACSSSKKISNHTIYKTSENQRLLYKLYDNNLSKWYNPYEIIEISTEHGKTNIIASGDKNKPPILLIHAMGVTATMWYPNVTELSKKYRVYAINTIGDLGKSELSDMDNYLNNGLKYAEWLNEITSKLNIDKCDVIGASMGGWISMNFAAYYPEKINKLVLLGPMGIKANTFGVMRRLFRVLFFPNQKNKEALTKWCLGDDQKVNDEMADYMNIALNCEGRIAIPKQIKKKHLNNISAKTLLVLGENDNPIGNPNKNSNFAEKHFQNIEIKTIDAGHLMSMEKSEEINFLIVTFLND
jgi:pimeloyl-ACP methyl ester carboxylesterase